MIPVVFVPPEKHWTPIKDVLIHPQQILGWSFKHYDHFLDLSKSLYVMELIHHMHRNVTIPCKLCNCKLFIYSCKSLTTKHNSGYLSVVDSGLSDHMSGEVMTELRGDWGSEWKSDLSLTAVRFPLWGSRLWTLGKCPENWVCLGHMKDTEGDSPSFFVCGMLEKFQ